MSEKRASPDEAKQNARVNIMQILGNVKTSSPTLPTRPSHQSNEEVSVDELAKERQAHVVGLVKTMQQEATLPPSPKPRSPRHSPTSSSPVQQKTLDKISPPKTPKSSPQRPPPPKLIPRRGASEHSAPAKYNLPKQQSLNTDYSSHKPKPPIRTRKKKFISCDDADVKAPPRQSEFVELSTSDIIFDADGEIRMVSNVDGAEREDQEPKTAVTSDAILEEREEIESGDSTGRIGSDSEKGMQNEIDLDKDDWEVIPDSATKEQSMKVVMDEPCLQPNGDVSKIESAIKSLSVKKKRPPPFRPPPYNPAAKTPPLPPKKKKTVSIQETAVNWNQLAEEVSSVAITGQVDSSTIPESQEIQSSQAQEKHIYESVESSDNNTKEAEGDNASIHLLSRPEHMLVKCTSFSSVESDLSDGSGRNGVHSRAGTMSEGAICRKEKSKSDARPKSEIPKGVYRELESSFEVIPQMGSDLNTVMTSLRQTDEKYQDASVYDLIQACSKALPHITSTSELPNRLPDFPDTARAHVIHELYTTEYTYVKGLEVLCEVFRDTLSPLIGEDTSHIFANVDDILNFNKSFLALLHSRLREVGPDASIGDLFIGMFTQAHKSMYAIYCSNYDSAEAYVTRLKKRKDLEQALINCLSNNRVLSGLTLPAYLITPVQRIPRYLLLLKDIIKHTPENHADRRSLLKAGEIMGELADFINAQVNESVTKKTFEALKDKVHGLADLDSPERNLVKEGQVYLKNIKKLYQCILFNDVLVFAHGDSRQSKVELQLNLDAVWFEDLEDLDPQTSDEDAIEIYTPERPYTIYTQHKAEKRLWMNKLRDTIYHYLLKEDKCERSSTCATESRHASFIYSDGRTYNGSFFDSRRHGKGTMTWPNKTVYVGDWVDDERCGEGELTYNTGEVYRGRWSEDKQNGYGELQFASNDVYRGHWKDGVRHGSGKILYANGDKFEGYFSSGQIEGKGKLTCVNGVMYDGEWKHSQRYGKGKLKTATKNFYEGEFQYNLIHGQGTMNYENKDTYKGRWKNGMRNGSGKFTSKMEGTYEGSWEDDLRHGAGKQIYPNKDVYEGGWERNKRHTRGKMTFSTGRMYDGDFVNDVICGEGEMKYSSNCKYQGSWVNGLRHGCGAMVYSDNSSYNGDWQFGMRHGHGEFVMSDGSVYRGLWSKDKPNGRGTLSIPYISYTYTGDWVSGKREGRGEETSQYGQYKGGWKGDLKHGYGEERTLVGTIFEGNWEKGRKNGRGVRKMIFGSVDEQTWKSGQLISDSDKMTAVELPFISRNDT